MYLQLGTIHEDSLLERKNESGNPETVILLSTDGDKRFKKFVFLFVKCEKLSWAFKNLFHVHDRGTATVRNNNRELFLVEICFLEGS